MNKAIASSIPNTEHRIPDSGRSITANRIFTMTDVDGGVGVAGMLERCFVNIAGGEILSVSKKPEFDNVTDYGDEYDILPGMINAHAHLELSQLKSPIDFSGNSSANLSVQNSHGNNSLGNNSIGNNSLGKDSIVEDFLIQKFVVQKGCYDFVQWIRRLVEFRCSFDYDSVVAISDAKCYFASSGETAAVVDIFPFGLNPSQLDIGKGVEWLRYPELIAWDSGVVGRKIELICGLCKDYYSGLSPHAPHTVSAELVEFAAGFGVGISMHLAESPDEMRLLKSRDGRLAEMMRKVDENYDPAKVLLGNRAMDYLQVLSRAPSVLIIHGNYLDDEEIRFLAKHNETMAVVYTPRSHDYFGFDEFPLQKMLDVGVCVLLGTDSKASTPDLNLSNEIIHAASIYPQVPREIFFQMATIKSAKFLNLTKNYGTIEAGKKAVFTKIPNCLSNRLACTHYT
ncbi:MAG: amidohydrolase family protein [Planctomycetaceae bacterium]|jgi:cytosine/adenosine deaminase-related metal-dependent hydrolase|nr:amidohydrolase family protein [Planctomycetaceae bacterium]